MILQAQGMTKSFFQPQKTEIFSGVNLQIYKGQSIAITGRSGEGKTTLLHTLSTLETASSGSLFIQGQKVTPSNSEQIRKKSIGFVFQSYNLLEDFTLLENVLMPSLIHRKALDRKLGLELLEQVGLVHRADFPVKWLSGGEKQRGAIARAICNQPVLIFADEPSGNLDSENAKMISDLLVSIVKKGQTSLVLATHDLQFAALCDTVYKLHNTHLVQI